MTDSEERAWDKVSDLEDKVKQLEALKNENKELKTVKIPQLERRIASIRGCHSVDVKKLKARMEQVERLKEENAELAAKIKHLTAHLEPQTMSALFTQVEEEVKQEQRLIEAKEIIESMLIYQEGLSSMGELKRRAEQFIKEIKEYVHFR